MKKQKDIVVNKTMMSPNFIRVVKEKFRGRRSPLIVNTCVSCRSHIKRRTYEVNRVRGHVSKLNEDGIHISEMVCNEACAKDAQDKLIDKHGFNKRQIEYYKRAIPGLRKDSKKGESTYTKYVKSKMGAVPIHEYECKTCKKGFTFSGAFVSRLKTMDGKGRNPEGTHWRELFCGEDCFHKRTGAISQLYSLKGIKPSSCREAFRYMKPESVADVDWGGLRQHKTAIAYFWQTMRHFKNRRPIAQETYRAAKNAILHPQLYEGTNPEAVEYILSNYLGYKDQY